MKRKKWSEVEELTLLNKYSDLLDSGTLAKLKTREKKFKPIAEHVNTIHHLQDPTTYPFKWSWRDVSIKVQNMRHQYLGVKQKIRASNGEFNWMDGENHWENFLKYKEVFGDVELEVKDNNSKRTFPGDTQFFDGLELDMDCDGFDEDEEDGSGDDDGSSPEVKKKRRLSFLGAQLLELRDKEKEHLKEKRKIDEEEGMELEKRQMMWERMEAEKRMRFEEELYEHRLWRMKMEEKREEEELQWRERMLSMQIEHEKQMVQMQANACQNQMQILGVMARFMCQFFGSSSDGLSAGLGGLPTQILQNMQHPGGLGDNGKPDSSSPSEFL